MTPAVSIALLLLSAAFVESLAQPTEVGDFSFQHVSGGAAPPEEEILQVEGLGPCSICKKVVGAVLKKAGNNATKEKIKSLLKLGCNEVPSLARGICKKLVGHVTTKLVNAIAKHGKPNEICVKVKCCKKKATGPWLDEE